MKSCELVMNYWVDVVMDFVALLECVVGWIFLQKNLPCTCDATLNCKFSCMQDIHYGLQDNCVVKKEDAFTIKDHETINVTYNPYNTTMSFITMSQIFVYFT